MLILTTSNSDYHEARARFGKDYEIMLTDSGPRRPVQTLMAHNISTKEHILLFGEAIGAPSMIGAEVYVEQSCFYQHADPGNKTSLVVLTRPAFEFAPEIGVKCYSGTEIAGLDRWGFKEDEIFDFELAFLLTFYPNVTCWRVVR